MIFVVLYSIASCGTFLKEVECYMRGGGNEVGRYDIEDCLRDISLAITWPISWIRYIIVEVYVRTGKYPWQG